MIDLLKRLDARLMDLLFPDGAVCLSCRRLTHGRRLCAECSAALESLRFDPEKVPEGMLPMPGNVSVHMVWRHEAVAQHLVLHLKENGILPAAEVLADGLADVARTLDLPGDTVVTWVPMPAKRLRERGIDHARSLAEATAQRLGLRCTALLTRVGEQHTQRGLNREERLQNLSGAFAVCGQVPRTILMIDDVLTTGATARACCDQLTQAERIIVLTATHSGR